MIIERNADVIFYRGTGTARIRRHAHVADRPGSALFNGLMTVPVAVILTVILMYAYHLSLIWALPLYSVTGSVLYLAVAFTGVLMARYQT